MTLVDRIHGGYVHGRRVEALACQFAELLPKGARVLDIGCGDGLLASRVQRYRPDVSIHGVDVLVRPETHIKVEQFDGRTIQAQSRSFDAVMMVDVIHHIDDAMPLLREAARVSRSCLLIKDHTLEGWLAGPTLRAMDYVGNARHGVALPHNYWSRSRWIDVFNELGVTVSLWRDRLDLYPHSVDWLFGRSLHFLARLDVGAKA